MCAVVEVVIPSVVSFQDISAVLLSSILWKMDLPRSQYLSLRNLIFVCRRLEENVTRFAHCRLYGEILFTESDL